MSRKEYLDNRLEMLEKKLKQKKKLLLKLHNEIFSTETKIYDVRKDILLWEMWCTAEEQREKGGKNG